MEVTTENTDEPRPATRRASVNSVQHLPDELTSTSDEGFTNRKAGRVNFACLEAEPEPEYGIQVRNAFKAHGNVNVLNGLNMFVPAGTVYALLGSSGCGKTTLLSCCVGLMDLDVGTITLSKTRRNEIGFMPQTVALYFLLTVADTFYYYGRIFGMDPKEIKKKSREISQLLDLPDMDRVVETLSGGQQRRVSLGVTLLNDPEILMLDEPTVGLDPILRNRIWSYLVEMCAERKKTIVITTHYIEEARQADTVGMMRGGVLLCEDTPAAVMASQNCDSIEKAFLHFSRIQQNAETYCESQQTMKKRRMSITETSRRPVEDTPVFSAAGFIAELVKNAFFIKRNAAILVYIVGMPIIVCLLFHLAIGRDPGGLRMAYVNGEILSDCDHFPGHIRLPRCEANLTITPVSCRYLKALNRLDVQLVSYKSIDVAKEAVARNAVWGVIEFMGNYTQYLEMRLLRNLKTNDAILERAMPSVWLDMSNHHIGMALKAKLRFALTEAISEFMKDCGWPEQTLKAPIRHEDPVYGEKEFNFNHYASPAISALVIFSLPMMYAVGVIVQEKETGVLQRSLVAGVSMVDVFMSHYVLQLITLCVQISIVIFFIFYLFGSPFFGNLFWTFSLLVLQGFSGLAMGFLLAIVFDKAMIASLVGIGFTLSFVILSGIVWPQEGQHIILKWFRWLSPVAYSVESLRANTVRGWGPLDSFQVAFGYISLISWIALYSSATHILMRFNKFAIK